MSERRFELLDRIAAALYKAANGAVPDLVLKRLGIATPKRRIEFYTLDHLLRGMPRVEGSILECGTYRGATLLGMTHILRQRGLRTKIYGADSFEGFPEPTSEDSREDGTFDPIVRKGGLGDTSYEALLARIRLLGWSDQITLVKGFFEDTLPQLANERFSLVHLDCDLYQSYLTCLDFVYPRMLPGSAIVFDDYGSPVYEGADRAVNEFFANKPEKLEHLPNIEGVRYFVRMQTR